MRTFLGAQQACRFCIALIPLNALDICSISILYPTSHKTSLAQTCNSLTSNVDNTVDLLYVTMRSVICAVT